MSASAANLGAANPGANLGANPGAADLDASAYADHTLDRLVVAREAAQDETVRIHAQLEREAEQRRADAEAAAARERHSQLTEAALRARVLDLERQLSDARLDADSAQAEARAARSGAHAQHARSQTNTEILKKQLETATDLTEMYKNTIRALEAQIEQLATAPSSAPSAPKPVDKIYSQELQDLIVENGRLEKEISQAHQTIQDLRLTELVNETLTADKQRLRAEIEVLRGVDDDNARLIARAAALERQSRYWAAFLESSDEIASPQQLTRKLAEARARAAATEKILATTQQVVEIQRAAAREAATARARADAYQRDLSLAADRQAKLEIRAKALETKVTLLETHLKESPPPQELAAEIRALLERLDSLPPPTKRPLSTESDMLDKLATSLMDTEKRAQEAEMELDLARKQLSSLANSAAEPAAEPQVLQIGGSSYDRALQSKLELLGSLERENKALRDAAAEPSSTHHRMVPIESLATLNTRLEITRREADLKYQDLDQLLRGFRTKVTQTKGAERSIFGYELELRPNATCLVRSQYALEGTDTSIDKNLNFFEFIYDPEKKRYTDLSYTSSIQRYDDLYRFWIKERKFLPGFLAAVLLQNHETYGNYN